MLQNVQGTPRRASLLLKRVSISGGHLLKASDVERNPLIVHCHLRWDFVWQRPQQIFSRLAEYHRVLFLEDPVWEDGEPRLIVSQPHPNLLRVVPVLPRQWEKRGVDAECEQVIAMLAQALVNHPMMAGAFASPVQWFYSPMTAPAMLGRFGASTIVYDCMDELANFRFAPMDIAEREKFLLSRADIVFTGGFQLFQSKSRHHENVHFFGCGVDVSHFGKARSADTVVPPELAALARPVVGYFGVIDERIDYELLRHLATALPHATVAMVGPFAKVDPDALPRAPNLHWLGRREYADLPAVVKAFDVCMMPFALNESTQYINPTKTLEYMAAGKEIVSTAVPDVVHNFTSIVEVAHTPEEIVHAVERAFTTPNSSSISGGLERANAETWDSIVSAMRSHVLQSLRSVLPGRTRIQND